MAEKKTPTKKRGGRVPQAYGTIDPEFSRKVMRCNMEIMSIRDNKPATVGEMRETIAAFFAICEKYAMIPTVEGLCVATKYDRNGLWDIVNGKRSFRFFGHREERQGIHQDVRCCYGGKSE